MYLYLRSIVLFLHYVTLNNTAALCLFYCGCTVRLPYHGIHFVYNGGPLQWLPTESRPVHHTPTCTMREMAALMISMRKDVQTACSQNELWREETASTQCGKELRCHGDVGCLLKKSFHGWRIHFLLEGKRNLNTSMSADGDGRLEDTEESHGTSNSPSVSGEGL